MAARDAGVDPRHLDAGHVLGLADRLANRLDGRIDVDDDAAAQPARRRGAHADDVQSVVRPR